MLIRSHPILDASPVVMQLMPTTLPSALTKGPPLLPIVIGASVYQQKEEMLTSNVPYAKEYYKIPVCI